jgi:glycosyltransferase involved in cell wall biosynthesis
MKPLVTVIVPNYNCEQYIWDCLDSIRKQDYENIEVIVIDDASTDNSIYYIKDMPWVKLIQNRKNLGECETTQMGFDMANGKYICRLSCDDMYVNADHISKQVEAMERTRCDVCYNNLNVVGGNIDSSVVIRGSMIPFQPLAKYTYHFDNIILKFPNLSFLLMLIKCPFTTSSVMFRTESFRQNLTWKSKTLRTVCDGELYGDMLLKKMKVVSVSHVGALWRTSKYQQTGKPETNDAYRKLRGLLYDKVDIFFPLWMRLGVLLINKIKPCGEL